MTRIGVAFALAACLLATNANAQAPGAPAPLASPVAAPPDALAAAIDKSATALVGSGHVPGVAIAVERHGRVTFARGYGFADAARKMPVTVDTRFEIGSITKQITAACVLQLVEAGKLSLDEHLGTYVSDYFIGRGVTIRQLLAHTSGIPEYLDGPDVAASAGSQPATYATILARVSAQPLDFPPGTRWKYSNTNYVLLGRVIELASHEPYERYVREHVFVPAGMTESGFIDDEKALPEMAGGFVVTPKGSAPAPPLRADWVAATGSVVSTVGDVLKWDDALLAGKIVAREDVALMRSPAKLANGAPTAYGFGWVIDSLDGHGRVWHNGATFGYYALNATFPHDDESIVVLANAASPGVENLARDAFAALHDDVAPANATLTPAPGEDPAVTARVREMLRQFQTGDVDRSALNATALKSMTPDVLAGARDTLASLGSPQALIFRGKSPAGDATAYAYRAQFASTTLAIVMTLDATGKIAGYRIFPP